MHSLILYLKCFITTVQIIATWRKVPACNETNANTDKNSNWMGKREQITDQDMR